MLFCIMVTNSRNRGLPYESITSALVPLAGHFDPFGSTMRAPIIASGCCSIGSEAIRLAEPNSSGTPVVVPSGLVITSPAYHLYCLGVQAPVAGQGAVT